MCLVGAPAHPLPDGVTLGNSLSLSRQTSPDQGHSDLGLRVGGYLMQILFKKVGACQVLPACSAAPAVKPWSLWGTRVPARPGLNHGSWASGQQSPLLHFDSCTSLEGVPSAETRSNNSQLLAYHTTPTPAQALSFLRNYPANKKSEQRPLGC